VFAGQMVLGQYRGQAHGGILAADMEGQEQPLTLRDQVRTVLRLHHYLNHPEGPFITLPLWRQCQEAPPQGLKAAISCLYTVTSGFATF
jgi:hypothetical protein